MLPAHSVATTTRSNCAIADPVDPGSWKLDLLYIRNEEVSDVAVLVALSRQFLRFQSAQNLSREKTPGAAFAAYQTQPCELNVIFDVIYRIQLWLKNARKVSPLAHDFCPSRAIAHWHNASSLWGYGAVVCKRAYRCQPECSRNFDSCILKTDTNYKLENSCNR